MMRLKAWVSDVRDCGGVEGIDPHTWRERKRETVTHTPGNPHTKLPDGSEGKDLVQV